MPVTLTALAMTPPDTTRQRNLRLALILASIALTFFLGFMAKMMWFSQ